MRILIIDQLHHKNRIGIELLFQYMKIDYVFVNDISKIDSTFDIIYSPSNAIDTSKSPPSQRFIFGPHFSVFPDNKLKAIKNNNDNSVYIQPSEWCVDLWKGLGVTQFLPIQYFPFPVDVEKFCPANKFSPANKFCPVVPSNKREKVFIYFKRRRQDELSFVMHFLKNRQIEFEVFNYVARYDEKHYLDFLRHAKFGIVLGAHESQGFAVEEALSCDVPLLVWNVRSLNQEVGCNYANLPATTIGYWDGRCGEYFYEAKELEKTFELFMGKIQTYRPREFILEQLSVEPCAKRFMELFLPLQSH